MHDAADVGEFALDETAVVLDLDRRRGQRNPDAGTGVVVGDLVQDVDLHVLGGADLVRRRTGQDERTGDVVLLQDGEPGFEFTVLQLHPELRVAEGVELLHLDARVEADAFLLVEQADMRPAQRIEVIVGISRDESRDVGHVSLQRDPHLRLIGDESRVGIDDSSGHDVPPSRALRAPSRA